MSRSLKSFADLSLKVVAVRTADNNGSGSVSRQVPINTSALTTPLSSPDAVALLLSRPMDGIMEG